MDMFDFVRNRKVGAGIAIVLIMAILLTGTFAWRSIDQRALNQATGGPRNIAGGRLHDDYQVLGPNFGRQSWSAGTTANKDVYIENFERIADHGQDIFLRIRLYEYMEIGAGAWYVPGEAGFVGRNATSLVEGAIREDLETWTPRTNLVPCLTSGTPNTNDDPFRRYWNWGFGGEGDCPGGKVFMPTFNRDPISRMTDVKGDSVDPQAAGFGAAGEPLMPTGIGGSHPFPAGAGNHNFWNVGQTHTSVVKYWDGTDHAITTYTATHTAQRTLNARVVTMANWLDPNGLNRATSWTTANNSITGYYWIIDVDGWAYWSAPLPPEQATGMLLSSITLHTEPEAAPGAAAETARWYYGIFVRAEMAIASEWYRADTDQGWFHEVSRQPSQDAIELMRLITDRTAEGTGRVALPEPYVYDDEPATEPEEALEPEEPQTEPAGEVPEESEEEPTEPVEETPEDQIETEQDEESSL